MVLDLEKLKQIFGLLNIEIKVENGRITFRNGEEEVEPFILDETTEVSVAEEEKFGANESKYRPICIEFPKKQEHYELRLDRCKDGRFILSKISCTKGNETYEDTISWTFGPRNSFVMENKITDKVDEKNSQHVEMSAELRKYDWGTYADIFYRDQKFRTSSMKFELDKETGKMFYLSPEGEEILEHHTPGEIVSQIEKDNYFMGCVNILFPVVNTGIVALKEEIVKKNRLLASTTSANMC